MLRSLVFAGLLSAVALGAGAAGAQWNGGPGRGGHDRTAHGESSHARPPEAPDQVVITGVVTGLGPEPDRVTIAYSAVDALNWPAGSTPFVVANPALLTGITVGQKVRFKLESAHIYELDRVPDGGAGATGR